MQATAVQRERRACSLPLSPTITNSERWRSLTPFSTSVRMR